MRRAVVMISWCLSAVGCLDLDPTAYVFDASVKAPDAGAVAADCARPCNTPPPRHCLDARTLEAFPTSGRCTPENGCGYNPVNVACAVSCVDGACTGEPCAGTFCDAPPATLCSDTKHLRVFSASGLCTAGNCSYSSTVVECPLGCINGACGGNTCAGKSCVSPPPSTCLDATALRTFVSPGACSGGQCTYAAADLTCARGCSNGGCLDDPCAGRVCDQPPANTCRDATTKRLYAPAGICEGAGQCRYASSDVACPGGQLCSAGVCASPSCSLNNGGCDPHATCTEGVPTRTCACTPGYQGDGLTCSPTLDAGSSCSPSTCAGCCDGTKCVAKADFTQFQCGSGTAGAACTSCSQYCDLEAGVCSLRPSAIFLTWRFPGSRSCTDAVTTESITEVEVTLDGANPSSQSCADGLAGGFNGILLDNVTPGTHVIRLRAFGASRFQYFEAASTVQVVANDTFSATLDFTYVVGGYPLKWRFLNAGVERSCAQLGSPQVYLNFRDRDGGGFIYPGAGVDVPCVSAGQVQGAVFPYFPRGSFDVFVQAVGPSSTLYRSDQLNPPRATVVAGVFPPLDAGVVFTAVYP